MCIIIIYYICIFNIYSTGYSLFIFFLLYSSKPAGPAIAIVPIIIVFPGIPVLPGSVIVLCIAPRTVAYTN